MSIKTVSTSLFYFFLFFLSCSCKKDPCIKDCPTCEDGILNQKEERIDCGGPCIYCNYYLCHGDGSNSYFPLKKNYWWAYNQPPIFDQSDEQNRRVLGDTIINSLKYFVVEYQASGQEYYRVASNGDIYAIRKEWYSSPLWQREHFFLPANPQKGQYWINNESTSDSFVVTAVDTTLFSDTCAYTNVLIVDGYGNGWGGNGKYRNQTFLYKKGVGLVAFQWFRLMGPGTAGANIIAFGIK